MELRLDGSYLKPDQHNAYSLAEVLEKHYDLSKGAQLFLSAHEWGLVIAALRSEKAPPPEEGATGATPRTDAARNYKADVVARNARLIDLAEQLERELALRNREYDDVCAYIQREPAQPSQQATPQQWQAVGKLLHHADQFIESFKDHVDRCRSCKINWQNLKDAVAHVRSFDGPK